MPFYEHVFIARQDAAQAQVDQLTQQVKDMIEQGGGKITKHEPWGLRSLTYKIKKNRKGHYVHFNFDSPWPAVAEVERQLRLNEDIIRYLTVRVDALDDTPSAGMLAKQAKERRDAKWGRREDEFGYEPPQAEEGAAS